MNLTVGGVTATISVPNAQTVVSNAAGTQLLAFSNGAQTVNSNYVTVISPLLLNTGNPVTVTVPGFDSPVFGIFSPDGSVAYILNCGVQCGRHAGQRADLEFRHHTADCWRGWFR